MTSRRGFLFGLGTALAAPAIVRAEGLMKLWVPPAPTVVMPPMVGVAAHNVFSGFNTEVMTYFANGSALWLPAKAGEQIFAGDVLSVVDGIARRLMPQNLGAHR